MRHVIPMLWTSDPHACDAIFETHSATLSPLATLPGIKVSTKFDWDPNAKGSTTRQLQHLQYVQHAGLALSNLFQQSYSTRIFKHALSLQSNALLTGTERHCC